MKISSDALCWSGTFQISHICMHWDARKRPFLAGSLSTMAVWSMPQSQLCQRTTWCIWMGWADWRIIRYLAVPSWWVSLSFVVHLLHEFPTPTYAYPEMLLMLFLSSCPGLIIPLGRRLPMMKCGMPSKPLPCEYFILMECNASSSPYLLTGFSDSRISSAFFLYKEGEKAQDVNIKAQLLLYSYEVPCTTSPWIFIPTPTFVSLSLQSFCSCISVLWEWIRIPVECPMLTRIQASGTRTLLLCARDFCD